MNLKAELEECAAALERGELAPERLRRLAAAINRDGRRQSLLYMQSFSTDIDRHLLGYTLVVNGERVRVPTIPTTGPINASPTRCAMAGELSASPTWRCCCTRNTPMV